jgi:hypothetical protein
MSDSHSNLERQVLPSFHRRAAKDLAFLSGGKWTLEVWLQGIYAYQPCSACTGGIENWLAKFISSCLCGVCA